MKWFPESAFAEFPPLLESKRLVRQMGPSAIPFLVAKLKKPEAETDDSVDERRKAAWGLGQLGAAAQPAVPALAQALQDQGDRTAMPDGHFLIRERVCTVAATALGEIGPSAREAIPALKESLHYGVGAALPALAKIAPESLQTLAVLTEAIQDYSQGSKSGETSYRYEALRGLASLAEHQVEALSSITIALKDPELCQEAVRLLLANKKNSAAAATALEQGCKSGSLMERADVAAALTLAGRRSPELLAVMLERLKQNDGDLSEDFFRALGAYGDQTKPAIPSLLKALDRTKNPVLLQPLIGTLAEIGKGNEEVRQALEPYLLEPPQAGSSMYQSLIRSTALTALGKVGVDPKKAIPALLQAMEDPSPQIRSSAAMGLAEYGASAKETVPKIIALLEDKDVAAMAAVALGNLGTNAPAAIPALVKALDSPLNGLSNNAANALGKFGPAARSAIPALEKLLGHSSDMVTRNAAFSLWQIDGRTDIVPLLIEQLKSQTGWSPGERMNPGPTRLFTLKQLGEIGPPAKAAVPQLKQLLQDPDPNVRVASEKAMDEINGTATNH